MRFRLRAAGYHGPDLFGPEALRIIADASEGLTRRINIYADKTLLAAFAAGTHTVTADHARAAVTDTQIVVTRRAVAAPRGASPPRAGSSWASSLGYGLAQLVRRPLRRRRRGRRDGGARAAPRRPQPRRHGSATRRTPAAPPRRPRAPRAAARADAARAARRRAPAAARSARARRRAASSRSRARARATPSS